MENYMAEVAKMLGVEMNEEFEIVFPSPSSVKTTAAFSENGFRIVYTDAYILTPYWKESLLHSLLKGDITIKRKPWKPKVDERFYIVAINGEIMHKHWDDCSNHKNYYRLGNCYRTYAEAEANRDKWISFYASDEVLEV